MSLVALVLLAADVCGAGAAAARQRDLANAAALLTDCVQMPGATLESFLLLAGVQQARGDNVGLLAAARAGLKRFPEEKRFYVAAGTHAGRQKRFTEAIAFLEPALKRWPDDEKLRSLLGSSYFGRGSELLDAGDAQAAAEWLRKATVVSPGDAEAHLNLGRALHNMGRYAEALASFDRVTTLHPDYPLLAFHRGMSLHYLGEFDKAVAELAGHTEYAPARLVRGLALLARGSFEEAAPDLQAAVNAMPDDAAAHYGYARALVRLGRLGNAEVHLRKTIELDRTDAAPVNLLVTVLRQLGRVDESRLLAVTAAERLKLQRSASSGEIKFQGPSR